jgi:Immunity protein 52
MSEYEYGISARWRVEPTSPAILGTKFLGVLDAISEAVPGVGTWQLAKPPYQDESVTIDEIRGNVADWVEDNPSTIDDVPDPETGYFLMAMNLPGRFSPKNLALTARVGGRLGDTIRFEVGSVRGSSDLETVTYPLFRAALLGIVTQFPPVWASAGLYVPGYDKISFAPGIPAQPKSPYRIPWLSYLCAPLTKGLVPPVGVPCERTADGGLLMIAAEERLDPTNPDHMRRARAIAEILIARVGERPRPGYWPIEEAWPPTPEALARRGPPASD